MEPTANEMLSDVLPSNGMDAQSAIDKVISQRQAQNVGQTETGLDEAQSAINTVIQQRKSPKTQLNSTFASVSGINPDDAAKAQQVGGAIGLGQDLTMRNAAEVKRIADQKRFEMYDLMESDPILGRQMMRREFASVAHDDIPQLTSVGALFKVAYSAATLSPFPKDVASEISQQYEGTQYQTEEALIYHWMNNNNLEEKDLSEETRQRLNFLEQNAPPPINTYLFGGLSYAAGQARSMAPEVAKYAIAGGVTGGALGLAGGPLAPATVAGGVLTGIGLGATAGVGVITSQIEGGMIYKDLLRSGVPKDVARTLSSIGGTANGLVEIGTLGLATAPFKPLLKKVIGEQIIKRGIKLAKPTAIGAVKTAAKYYAMAEGGEQIQELSQETVSIIVEEIARSYAPGEYESKLATPEGRQELANRYLDVAEQTFKATAIMGSFGPMLNLAVDAKNIRDSAKTKQFLTDLSKNVQATKLKGRSPSALANFVAAQAQGTAAETMYVDAEEMVNVLNQSGLTAQQIDNALPGVREQLAQATSGGDIQIPTAQFAANIVGTKLEAPLMEHARLAPDAISAKQAIAQQETMQQNMKDAQAEMAVQEVTNAQFVREAKEIEKVVNDQLVAAGRPATEALFAAKLVQARAVTGAAATGITPAQWVAQHPVPTFQSQRQAAQQAPAQVSFEQAAVPATAMPSVTTANPVSPIGMAIASANLNEVKSVEESDTFFKKVWKKLLIASGKQMRSKSDESVKEAAKLAVADIQEFVKNNPQFSDYYSQDWMKTRSLLDEYAGRAITDDEFQMYRVICGLTSPNTKLPSNISDTVKLWTHWMENGSFDGFLLGPKPVTGKSVVFESDEIVSGTTANTKIRTVKIIARLVKELGSVKAAINYLREPVTSAELNKVNKSLGYAGNVSNIGNIRALVKMATGQDKLIPRMFVFGQKVGAYTLNAVGDERFTTVDIWESRYIRSFFSGMFENEIGLPTDEKEHDTFVRFGYAFKDEMEKVTGRIWTPSSLQALRWFYIIAATRSAGYSKASTNETISTYTSRVLKKEFDYNQARKTNATRSTTTPPRKIAPQKYERDISGDLDAQGITDPKQRQQITTGSWIQFARSNKIGDEVGFQFDTDRSGVPRGSGPLKGLATVATHTPGSQLAKAFAKAGASIQPYVELAQTEIGAKAFSDRVRAINANSKFGTAVYVYSDAEYMGKRLFISESGKSGFALSSDGDIVSVFSEAGSREGRGAMALATQMGGTKLDCFDTVLPGYYAVHGFRAVARIKWNDEYTPTGWDFDAFAQFNGGRPDVVYMVYEANYVDSYSNTDGVVVADPSEAVAIQTQDIKTEQDRVAANKARDAEVIKPSQTLFQSAVPATFYSALGVEVGKSTTKSASADSWKQQIKGLIAKGVVKEKEVYWSGLDNWLDLQEGKITKEQVQEFLDANGVKVEVQQKSDDLALKDAVETGTAQAYLALQDAGAMTEDLESAFNELEELNAGVGNQYRRGQLHSIIDEVLDAEFGTRIDDYIEGEYEGGGSDAPTKYSRYQLPGGTNYREALVTLPRREKSIPEIEKEMGFVRPLTNEQQDQVLTQWKQHTPSSKDFQTSHWNEPNILVHLRMNDRVDADGKKVLFVEELQSDWGQAGREKGFVALDEQKSSDLREQLRLEFKAAELNYQDALDNLKIQNNRILAQIGFSNIEQIIVLEKSVKTKIYEKLLNAKTNDEEYMRAEENAHALGLLTARAETKYHDTFGNTIPRAPFVESTSGWLELGLKQILLEAVNGGYDRVAFVDGDQSVERYRKALTEAVDEVEITRNDDGTYTYSAIRGGKPVQGEQSVKADRIEEVFGKAGSKQLLEQADANPNEIHTIASGDIEIGGEGMRKFYNAIIPQALNKMLKKLGGDKIGEVKIGKSVGRKINAKEISNQAVKLINDEITINEFRAETDLEKSDVSDVALEELQQANRDTSDKARTREIANAFAANLKVKFAGGKSMTQQGFTVTPALAAQVSQGLPLFQAAEGGARGEYDPIKNLIGIGKNADYSTVAHELAHWYVVDLFRTASDSTASEASRADADILLKWFGIAGDNVDQRLANWNAMTLDEQRRHHEAVAYNWELYLHTGKAPSVELQGVFDRFRRWLTRAYKSIRDDLNEIYKQQFGTDLPFMTDEVRGVFDRMLASEEQIARREAIDNFKGMYQTQEESGMNDATWAAYQAEIAEAHEMAVTDLTKATVKQMEWLSGARKGILKTMQAAHNALRRSVQGEESKKMDNEPVRKAERFFKTGKMVDPDGKEIEVLVGNKIDSVAVGSMYPTSTTGLAPAVDLTKLRGMTMEGGLAPDLAAEMFGFSSGDELIRALAELKPFKDELKERTDARMLDEHGGMNTEAEKEEAVNKALANEVRARIVAIENRYLTKVKTPVAVIMQGAKELARTILGRMAIKDIKPRNYVAAEARVAKDKHTAVKAMQSPETAGKSAYTRSFNEQIAAGVEESVAASEALVKSVEAIKRAQAKIDAHKKQYGDVDPAIVAAKASHQQVIQGQLAKEGYKILEEVDKALAYVKRIVSDVNRKNMGADHADQIEAILERFGLISKYVAPTNRTPLATWAQVQQDIGFDIEIPDIVQESVRKNFLELTPEEFQDVIDTVKQIAHTGKAQQLVLTMDRKVTFEKAKTEIVDSINANAGGRKAKTRTATTNIGRSIETLTGFFAAHLKAAIVAQIMDGGKDGGPLWNYLIRSANTAGNKETTMRAAATKRISEILDPVFKGGKMGGAGVYFPSVDRSFNRESVLTIALNMGNESNMQRLLDGEGWTIEQVMPIIQSLTAAELNAVQEVWDYSETFKAEIIEKSRRTVGREPNWIEPKPFQVMSADGQMVSLKGGYYPVKYDPRASARSQSLSAADQALRDLKDAHIASTTRRSYTKSRVKEVHDRPLLLNLSGLYSGIGEVIHDLSWHEWLIDSNRLMRSSAFDKAVREQYGVEFKDQITSWIKDVAAGDKGANNAGEMALNYLRQGVSAAGLGFNLMSAVGQITGFAQSVVKVGAKWIGRGIAVSASDPKAAIERVYALSSFMANRGSTQFRELNEIKNMVRGENTAMKRVRVGTYFLMMQMQRMVDVPTWIGAYEKQLSINSDEKLAIAIADQAVIDSQGGGMLKDLSAIERGGPIQKLFTVFYSFMNTNLNLAVLKGMTEKNAGKWVAQQTMLWVVPVVTMYMLKKLLTPQAGDDDDKFDLKEMAKELAAEELSFLMGSFMVVREFADAAKIVTGAKTYGTDYRGPAGLRMIGDTYKFATQAAQLEFDTAFRKAAINIIGSSSGLPAAQINRTIDGIEALLEGETENITAPLFGVKKR